MDDKYYASPPPSVDIKLGEWDIALIVRALRAYESEIRSRLYVDPLPIHQIRELREYIQAQADDANGA